MEHSFPLVYLSRKQKRLVDNCTVIIDLVHIYLGDFGFCALELLPLPHISIGIGGLGQLYIGLVSGTNQENEPSISFLLSCESDRRSSEAYD